MSENEVTAGQGAGPGGLSRRQMMARAALGGGGLLSMPAFLAACGGDEGGGDGGGAEKGGAGNFPQTPKYRFVFVNHVTTNPFFVPTQYGAQDASAILGTTFQWTGSKEANVAEMIDAMNTAVSGKADGIAVCDVDAKAFRRPIEKAMAAGIPVVTYNADGTPDSEKVRLAYIGQDLFLSGVEMGKRIVDLVPSGKVVIFIATPGANNIQPRADGAIQEIEASGKDIEVEQIATGAEVTEELSRIDAYYQGNKDVKGMFAVDGGSTQGAGQIVQKYQLQGKVVAGGYDLLPKTLELVKSKDLAFTIDQQPYLQGFYPVMQLYLQKLSGGLTGPSDNNTGLKFLTDADVDPYLTTKTRFEGSSDKQQLVKDTRA